MSDNVVKSTAFNDEEPSKTTKKTAAKKAAVKKAAPKKEVESETFNKLENNKSVSKVVVFESGFSYRSNGLEFTKDNRIQEVSEEQANHLLTLENFRLPDQLELEEYLANKEV